MRCLASNQGHYRTFEYGGSSQVILLGKWTNTIKIKTEDFVVHGIIILVLLFNWKLLIVTYTGR